MAKSKRKRSVPKTRTRTVVKYRTRTRTVKVRGARRAPGTGIPFKSSGSALARVQGSAFPVLKMAGGVVTGATLAAYVARLIAPRLKGDPTKIGAAVTAIMLLLGSIASRVRFGFLTPRVVQLVALGGVADGGMRLLTKLRAAGRIPGLPRGNAGLLASGPYPENEEARRVMAGLDTYPILLQQLQD